MLDKIVTDLREYYTERVSDGPTALTVGWKSTQAQLSRFDQLVKVIDHDDNFTINDLGCGVGDFSEYLASKKFRDFKYFGYDVLDMMLDRANERYGSNPNRAFITITHSNEMRMADYSVASGILNLKFTIAENEWLLYVLDQINSLSSRSTRGFAFNALTKYSDKEFMKDELYYADPCLIFDYCKRNISPNVALLHDYQEYDFTIIVRKP